MAALRLIVGLGNPGAEYARTRHNAGFWFIDAVALALGVRFGLESKLGSETVKTTISGHPVLLAKPTTFMNKSGHALSALSRYYKIEPEEILVAHDELDLPPGTARLKFDGGHGGQNGLRDIIAQFGHGKFHRLRLGIGHPGHKDRVTGWVLGRPSAHDEQCMLEAVSRSMDVLALAVRGEMNAAMKALHTASKATEE